MEGLAPSGALSPQMTSPTLKAPAEKAGAFAFRAQIAKMGMIVFIQGLRLAL
jgi:hypothetical protein